MTPWRLIARNLCGFARTGMAVALALATATAVITGSLLVGDSVRGSLRDTALARLGAISTATVGSHAFREALAGSDAPLLQTRGALTAENDATVPRVQVYGVEGRFWALFGTANPVNGRQAAVNAALARDLGVAVGDDVILHVPRAGAGPADSLFAQRSRQAALRTVRLTVAAILPDRGVGGFALTASSQTPRNVFIDLHWLQGQLDDAGLANVIVSHGTELAEAVRTHATLDDLGLTLKTNPAARTLTVQSTDLLLRRPMVKAIADAADRAGVRAAPTSFYLAAELTGAAHGTSYALLGAPPPGVEAHGDGVWLSTWSAEDLAAKPGDVLTLSYLVPAWDGVYRTETRPLTVRGVVPTVPDTACVPPLRGISTAERIDEWAPPFPVDMHRVTPRDETYWQRYRTTPKAFVSLETARALWARGPEGAQADWVTGVRVSVPAGDFAAQARRFTTALSAVLPPEAAGVPTLPVRTQALAASEGATDFAGLFLALGFFLIAAAVGLAAMTMRLLIDRRAAEVGLLLAVGIAPRTVTGILLAEGAALAALGAVIGVPLGALYGWGVVHALTTWWAGAVADTPLWFHATPGSLWIGAVSGFVIGLPAAWWGTRALKKARVTDLLGGAQALAMLPAPPRGAWALGGSAVLAVGCFAAGAAHALSPLEAFFCGGAALLVAGLLGCGQLLARALTPGVPTFPRLALRNAAANRGRSVLVIGLLACASFLLITVAASVRDFSRFDVSDPRSGAGGFTLLATASLPILYDFGTPTGREKLGFAPEDEPLFAGVQVYPFLESPGDEVSCLNLAKSAAPRLLGVPDALRARGGFTINTAKPTAQPWALLTENDAFPAFGDADSVEWSLHAELGGRVPLAGAPAPLHIVGVLPGSLFANALLVSDTNFRTLYPGISAPRYFLISAPREKADAVAASLRRTLGDLGLEVHPTREVLADYARVENTYLACFLALGGLGLLLGTLGLVVVLLRNALERRREFALLLAVGFTRAQLVRLLLLENIGLLVAGQLLGAVAALAAVAPQLGTAHVAWGGVAVMLGGNLALGIAATAFTAWPATRGRLLDGLRGD